LGLLKIGKKMDEQSPTSEELKQMRDAAFNVTAPKSWVWNEEKMSYVPPFPPPDEEYPYLWNEGTLAWDPFPGYPREE
jgi:hypothetical protein